MRRLLFYFLLTILIGAIAFANATTWSDYTERLTTYSQFDGLPDILQTSDGAMRVFWSRNDGEDYDIFYTISFDEGASWSPETPLVADAGGNTGIAVLQASDGTLWAVWASDRTGNFEIFYKTSSDLGVSWSNDTQLTFQLEDDLKPAICQLSNGSIWVTWGSDRTGAYDLYLKTSSDAGSSWSGDIRLTADPDFDKSPSVFQASNGAIWVVWGSDKTANGDIYCMIYNGSLWLEETVLTSGPVIDTNPCVLQTLDGKIWIFWSRRLPADNENATDDVYYMYSSDNGASWSGDFQLTTDPYDDMWPSAVQTHNTRIWVAWTSDRVDQPDYGNWDIYIHRSLVGDLNEDGVVDILDLSIMGMAYGTFEGQPGYNPIADINVDGVVDMRDLSIVTRYFGET